MMKISEETQAGLEKMLQIAVSSPDPNPRIVQTLLRAGAFVEADAPGAVRALMVEDMKQRDNARGAIAQGYNTDSNRKVFLEANRRIAARGRIAGALERTLKNQARMEKMALKAQAGPVANAQGGRTVIRR